MKNKKAVRGTANLFYLGVKGAPFLWAGAILLLSLTQTRFYKVMRKLMLAVLPLCLVSTALAQSQPTKPPEFSFMEKEVLLKADGVLANNNPIDSSESAKLMATEYMKSVQDPRVVNYQLSQAAQNYYIAVARFGISAPQVTQVCSQVNTKLEMLQVAQNQRIIELLEKLANKK